MKKKLLSALLSLVIVAPMLVTTPVMAEEAQVGTTTKDIHDGYFLKWSDEFDGTSLNRDSWNVELHEPGWVNEELQEYVDSEENIRLEDGKLVITPVKKVEVVESQPVDAGLFVNADFADGMNGWAETIANWGIADASSVAGDGKIKYTINNPGDEDWNVQLKQSNIALSEGKTYRVSYDVLSSVSRTIKSGVMSKNYDWYGGSDPALEAGKNTNITFEFTMSKDDEAADFYISMGETAGAVGATPAGTVEISNLSLIDLSGGDDIATDVEDLYLYLLNPNYATSTCEDGVLTIDVTYFGDADWNIQPKMPNPITLNEGTNYKVEFDITSTIDKKFKASVSKEDYSWYAGVEKALTANETEHISFETGVISKTDTKAGFSINIGNALGETELGNATITISNFSIVAENDNEAEVGGEPVSKEKVTYTSGRVSTQNKETFTYGLFEARAKVPEGSGYLPAFWLMANDEEVYGQWPRCGEIDCMEVMGQKTDKVYGTIHYGESVSAHKQNQGTYVFEETEDGFHTYACEWNPDKITWYIDGTEYYSTSNWYTAAPGQNHLSYPAPFDQPFYIILNLAVGGSWVGDIDENTFNENNDFVVDYVRVYQKADYDENVTAPEPDPIDTSKVDDFGFYIKNGEFELEEDFSDDEKWIYLNNEKGEGLASIVTEEEGADKFVESGANKALKISTTNEGVMDYSIQLVQPGIPFVKTAKYKISFDAYAAQERTMRVDVKGHTVGYIPYMETKVASLGTDVQHYEYEFTMKEASDGNARIEFNMGKAGSTADIFIDNVKLEMTADPVEEEIIKNVLPDGNYLYNGSFDEGPSHLGEWDISSQAVGANYYVTSFSDGRRLKVTAPTNAEVSLKQEKLEIVSGKRYLLSFDAESTSATKAVATIGGIAKEVAIAQGSKNYTAIVEIPEGTQKEECSVFELVLSGKCDLLIDNIKLSELGMITDGDFSSGSLGSYEFWKQAGDAEATASVVNGEVVVTVNKTGTEDWHIQLKQNNLKIEEGNMYVLSFKAKSDIDRNVRVLIQGPESRGWDVYSKVDSINNEEFAVTSEYKDYSVRFIMDKETDPNAFLSICLGKVDREINEEHNVSFDDIRLDVFVPVRYNGETLYYPVGNMISENAFNAAGETVEGLTLDYEEGSVSYNTAQDGSGDVVTADTVVTAPLDVYKVLETEEETEDEYWDLDLNDYDFIYSGSQIKPVVTVTNGEKVLVKNKDYKVTYKNNINTNIAVTEDSKQPTVIVTFIGNYAGTDAIKEKFNIHPVDLMDPQEGIDVAVGTVKPQYNYTKSAIKPAPSVKVNGKKLDSKKLTYAYYEVNAEGGRGEATTPKKPGKYVVVITGKNGYIGEITRQFTILEAKEKTVGSLTVKAGKTSVAYSGTAIESKDLGKTFAVSVKNGAKSLVEGEDYTVTTEDDTLNVGKINLVITGIEEKGYYGTKTIQVSIKGTALKNATITGIVNRSYNDGKPVEQEAITVKYGSSKVLEGVSVQDYEEAEDKSVYDYIFEYANNTECGTASVKFTGVNGYTGSVTKTFKITGTDISKAKVSGFASSVTYVGKPVVMDLKLDVNGEKITVIEKSKYDTLINDEARQNFKAVATYTNNTKAGKAKVVITGVNGYEGKISRAITIKAYNIASDSANRMSVKLSQTSFEYDKSGVKPVPVVKFNGVTLTQGTDYKLVYENNKAVAGLSSRKKPTVKVVGIGNYTGTNAGCKFEIVKAQLKYHAQLTASDVKYVNEKNNYKTSVKVVDENGKVLKAGTDYKVTAYYEADSAEALKSKAKVAAPADGGKQMRVTVEGCGYYETSLTATYNMYTYDISKYTFTVNTSKNYTGKPIVITPDELSVTYKGKAVANASDILANIVIDSSSYKNNVNAGTASVVVSGKGNYGGTKKVTYKISGKRLLERIIEIIE